MTNGWYTVTETYIFGLAPSILMEWARLYDIDLDDDIDEIRQKVADIMSRKSNERKVR